MLISQLIRNSGYIRLVHNFSPNDSYLFEIDEREAFRQIARRFLKYNSYIFFYLWQYNGRTLDCNKTLTENDLPSEELFHNKYRCLFDHEDYPTILLYFSDDLTIA